MKRETIVVIINNLGVGGAERVVIDGINEMLARGIDVRLITLKPEKEGHTLSSQCKIGLGWHMVNFTSFFNIPSWFGILSLLYEWKPKAVVTHLWYANVIGGISARMAFVPTVISFEQNVYDNVKTRKQFLVDKFLQYIYTRIAAVSGAVKKSLIEHGIQEKRIKVIHNAVDLKRYKKVAGSEIKNELRLEKKDFLFIFVGRLIRQKAVDVLIKAFSSLGGGFLVIVGDGIDRASLEELVRNRGIADRVFFLGIRSDIPRLLLSSDCFVLPSRWEGLPLVVAEALGAELPIVISNFEAAREIIEDGVNGLIVPIEDDKALAGAMKDIMEDRYLRERLRSGARTSAHLFSIEYQVDNLLNLIP